MRGKACAGARTDESHSACLNLKLLRLATHSWWLGNPVVYEPDTADPFELARELARAGVQSGTLELSERLTDASTAGFDAALQAHDQIQVVLILRPVMPCGEVATAAAHAVATVAQDMAGHTCVVRKSREVILAGGQPQTRWCQIAGERQAGSTIVGLSCALGGL